MPCPFIKQGKIKFDYDSFNKRGEVKMISKSGVVYDLKMSDYRYKADGLTYVFSSQLHLNKFKKKVKENRDTVNYSLSNRFNLKVDVSQLADVVLYRKIETRGFLIVSGEGNELCLNNIRYTGGVVTIQN